MHTAASITVPKREGSGRLSSGWRGLLDNVRRTSQTGSEEPKTSLSVDGSGRGVSVSSDGRRCSDAADGPRRASRATARSGGSANLPSATSPDHDEMAPACPSPAAAPPPPANSESGEVAAGSLHGEPVSPASGGPNRGASPKSPGARRRSTEVGPGLQLGQLRQLMHDDDATEGSSVGDEGAADEAAYEKLSAALRTVGASVDASLGIAEFRNFFASVFKRPIDSHAWAQTEELFQDIDKSGDGQVGFGELISYLSQPIQPVPRPNTLRKWLWMVVAPIGSKGTYDPRVDPHDRKIMWIVLSYRFLSQVCIIIALSVLFIESLPSMQNNADGTDPGTHTTFCLETLSVAFFTMEFIVFAVTHPAGPLSYYFDPPAVNAAGRPVVAGVDWEMWYCGAEKEGEAFGNGQCGPHDGPHCEDCAHFQQERGPPHRPLLLDKDLWVDILSVTPYYVNLAVDEQAVKVLMAVRFARMMRMLQLLRSLRMVVSPSGFVDRLPKLVTALKRSSEALMWLALLIFCLVSISSTFMYYAELAEAHFDLELQQWVRNNDSQYIDAGKRTLYQSIPESMWWALVTISTVGYGDYSPVTRVGKLVGSATILTGLVIVVFPITILGNVFSELNAEQRAHDAKVTLCRSFYREARKWLAHGGAHGAHADPHISPQLDRGMHQSPLMHTHPPPQAQQHPQETLLVEHVAAGAVLGGKTPASLSHPSPVGGLVASPEKNPHASASPDAHPAGDLLVVGKRLTDVESRLTEHTAEMRDNHDGVQAELRKVAASVDAVRGTVDRLAIIVGSIHQAQQQQLQKNDIDRASPLDAG